MQNGFKILNKNFQLNVFMLFDRCLLKIDLLFRFRKKNQALKSIINLDMDDKRIANASAKKIKKSYSILSIKFLTFN